MTITQEEYDSLPIEDRLMYQARVSPTATYSECQLMDDASEEIRRLRQEIEELNYRLDCAGEHMMGEDI